MGHHLPSVTSVSSATILNGHTLPLYECKKPMLPSPASTPRSSGMYNMTDDIALCGVSGHQGKSTCTSNLSYDRPERFIEVEMMHVKITKIRVCKLSPPPCKYSNEVKRKFSKWTQNNKLTCILNSHKPIIVPCLCVTTSVDLRSVSGYDDRI